MNRVVIPYLLLIIATGCKSKSITSQNRVDSVALHEKIVTTIESFEKGRSIFSKYCNGCHYRPDSKVIADPPMFDNLFQTLPSPPGEYFIKFLQDSKALKDSGDKFAQQLDQAFDMAYEHYFRDSLSIEDFRHLIIYFKIGTEIRNR